MRSTVCISRLALSQDLTEKVYALANGTFALFWLVGHFHYGGYIICVSVFIANLQSDFMSTCGIIYL